MTGPIPYAHLNDLQRGFLRYFFPWLTSPESYAFTFDPDTNQPVIYYPREGDGRLVRFIPPEHEHKHETEVA